jgi:archaellum biogenesis ATPase FlaH
MKILDLKEYDGEDRIISSHEMADWIKSRKDVSITIKSGMLALDHALEGGFFTGELYAISGPTKNGKTLLSQTLTKNFFMQQYFSLWFTFELPPKQFLGCFPDLPLIYMPRLLKSHDLDWVCNRIIESYQKYHTRVVFLDHLHYLFDMAKTKNPSMEIGTVIRRLKKMAVDNNLLIFLMCHTSKAGVENLSYQSIRDSSFVSQEADSVFLMVRTPKGGENKSLLSVEFHRRTGVIERKIKLEKVNGYIQEETIPF